MKWALLVAMLAVGCSKSPAPVAPKSKSAKTPQLWRDDVAAIVREVVAEEFAKRDAAEAKETAVRKDDAESKARRAEYAAAVDRQKAAQRKAKEIEEEKDLAEFTLTAKERARVDDINELLEQHGLWGVSSGGIAVAMSKEASPLCREALGRAAERRDNGKLDKLMDSLQFGSLERILFAGSFDLLERVTVAEMLLQLHNGTWRGSEEQLAKYRDKLFFQEAIAAFRKKTR